MRRLRAYADDDHAACVTVARSNAPDYVLPDEVEAYAGWLERACGSEASDDRCDYLVVEDEAGTVVACGGIAFAETANVATLCWGLVRNDLHRTGLGTLLVQTRLAMARARRVDEVLLDTSQHTTAFFARFGFRITSTTTDGYGPGLHRHDMALRLARGPG